jgi:MFS superfamily sulfate permease-like transporter
MEDCTNPKEFNMMESILTIIVLLMVGACVGVGVLIAILWFSVDRD